MKQTNPKLAAVPKFAAVWIASGKGYIEEAETSCRYFRKHLPEPTTILFTDTAAAYATQFDKVVRLPDRHESDPWYLDFVRYCQWVYYYLKNEDYKRAILLDTDVHVVSPAIGEMYTILDHFDIAGAHAPGRETTCSFLAPQIFPEINTGLLSFAIRPHVEYLFDTWRSLMLQHLDKYGDNDQGAFRDALLTSFPGVRLCVIPPEYHVRTICGGFASYPVAAIHGRGDIDLMERFLNGKKGMRVWTREELSRSQDKG